MADVTLLQQDILLLKLRIAKLEDDKKKLQAEVTALIDERHQTDIANLSLMEKLKSTERVCQAAEWKYMGMETRYHNALSEISHLKSELIDALGSDAEVDTDTD